MKRLLMQSLALITVCALAITNVIVPVSAVNVDDDTVVDYINSVHTFIYKDLSKYKLWEEQLSAGNTVLYSDYLNRLRNAIDKLESGIDIYDDFGNFGNYVSGETYPKNVGDIMPTTENTSSYDIIWAGLNEVDGDAIIRKPYTSYADYSKASTGGAHGNRINTFIGSKNGVLHFSSYDVIKQIYNGEPMNVEYWYSTPEKRWKPGVFCSDMQNAKLNLLSFKTSFNSGKPIQSFKISVPVNVQRNGIVIYDYQDINNWQAVSYMKYRGWQNSFCVFRRINGVIYAENGITEMTYEKYTNTNAPSKALNVLDAAEADGQYVDFKFDYDSTNSRYNLTLSYKDKEYTRALQPGDRLANIYLGAFPVANSTFADGYEGYFKNLEIKYISGSECEHVFTNKEDIHYLRTEAADCTEKNTYWKSCSKCGTASGTEYFTGNTIGAHSIISVAKKEKTCFESGNIAYTHCTRCGKYWNDKGVEISLSETVIQPGHTAVNGWSDDENGHWKYCIVCDALFNQAAHTPDFSNDIYNNDIPCSVCGRIIEHKHEPDFLPEMLGTTLVGDGTALGNQKIRLDVSFKNIIKAAEGNLEIKQYGVVYGLGSLTADELKKIKPVNGENAIVFDYESENVVGGLKTVEFERTLATYGRKISVIAFVEDAAGKRYYSENEIDGVTSDKGVIKTSVMDIMRTYLHNNVFDVLLTESVNSFAGQYTDLPAESIKSILKNYVSGKTDATDENYELAKEFTARAYFYAVANPSACTHTWVETEDDKYIKKTSDCHHRNWYWKNCSQCGAVSDTEYFLGLTVGAHSLDVFPAKNKTCFENGNIAYTHCTVCNYYFDSNGKQIKLSATVIPAGHTADEWKFSATSHWHMCIDCNEVYDCEEHTPDRAAATYYADKKCTVCGAVLEQKKAPDYYPEMVKANIQFGLEALATQTLEISADFSSIVKAKDAELDIVRYGIVYDKGRCSADKLKALEPIDGENAIISKFDNSLNIAPDILKLQLERSADAYGWRVSAIAFIEDANGNRWYSENEISGVTADKGVIQVSVMDIMADYVAKRADASLLASAAASFVAKYTDYSETVISSTVRRFIDGEIDTLDDDYEIAKKFVAETFCYITLDTTTVYTMNYGDGRLRTAEFADGMQLKLQRIPIPYRRGYKFAGWALGENELPQYGIWTPTNGAIIYAVWAENKIKGDINNDGTLDIRDLVRSKKASSGTVDNIEDKYRADFNYNGDVDAEDMVTMRKLLLG